MSDEIEKLMAEFEETRKAYETLVETKGKALFGSVFAKMFDACPSIRAIKWTQYTPHFNDGDACEFSVHDRHATFVDAPNGWKDWKEISYGDGLGDAQALVKALDKRLDPLEDVFEATFGDHVEVTAKRDAAGAVFFEVEEYSHD